ncbi:hypothetical protein AAEX37_01096 [Oligella sp. MSHR50489EDL]
MQFDRSLSSFYLAGMKTDNNENTESFLLSPDTQ